MANEGFTGPFARARRELRRSEMGDFGGELAWLGDHSLIPDVATSYGSADATPFDRAGMWVLSQLVEWSARVHLKLDYQGVFDKHDLSSDQRVGVRTMISELAEKTYGPGIESMCEIFAAVPEVAAREGVTDPEHWTKIASDARAFAESFAKNGTNVQAAVRMYLADATAERPATTLLPEKLRLDTKTGITSAIPVHRLVEIAVEVTDRFRDNGHTENVCIALQAPVKGIDGHPTMWDAIWDAYTHIARSQIYPHHSPSAPKPVSTETEEDVFRKMHAVTEEINAIEAAQRQRYAEAREMYRGLGRGVAQIVEIH